VKETDFRKAFCNAMTFHTDPVEHPVIPGMADVYCVINQRVVWCELKYIKINTKSVEFRMAQPPWLMCQRRLGVESWVIVKCNQGHAASYGIWLPEHIGMLESKNGFQRMQHKAEATFKGIGALKSMSDWFKAKYGASLLR